MWARSIFQIWFFLYVIIIHTVLDLQHLSLLVLLFISDSQSLDINFCHTKGVIQFSNKCFPFDIITQCYCDQDIFPSRLCSFFMNPWMLLANVTNLFVTIPQRNSNSRLSLSLLQSLCLCFSHTQRHRHTQYQVLFYFFRFSHISPNDLDHHKLLKGKGVCLLILFFLNFPYP